MTNQTNTKPIRRLNDGNLTAAIWRNTSKEGTPYYAVTLARRYKRSDGTYADSHSYGPGELLRLADLAQKARAEIAIIRQSAPANEGDAAPQPSAGGAA